MNRRELLTSATLCAGGMTALRRPLPSEVVVGKRGQRETVKVVSSWDFDPATCNVTVEYTVMEFENGLLIDCYGLEG